MVARTGIEPVFRVVYSREAMVGFHPFEGRGGLERVLKMPFSTLTLLYKEFDSYKWEGCKRIHLVIQLT